MVVIGIRINKLMVVKEGTITRLYKYQIIHKNWEKLSRDSILSMIQAMKITKIICLNKKMKIMLKFLFKKGHKEE